MIASLFVLVAQWPGSSFLATDFPNVRCVLPTHVPGAYIVAEDLERDYRWHWLLSRPDRRPIVTPSGWPNTSNDRQSMYAFTDVNPFGVLDLEKWKYREGYFDLQGWNRNREMGLKVDPQTERQRFFVAGSKFRIPANRRILMFSSDGEFLATERPGKRTRNHESQYFFNLDLYAIENHKLRPVKSLGEVWYDGGSTGAPSLLAVSGDGLVAYDVPGGGGVLRRPYLVGADGIQRQIAGLGDHKAMDFFAGSPIAFKEGILMPIEVVEPTGIYGDPETPEYARSNWLVWYSKAGVWGWATPTGSINIFKSGPMQATIVKRAKGGVELHRLELPPVSWRRLQTPKFEPIKFDSAPTPG